MVPGYVKCPRCHAVLPGAGGLRRSGIHPGGTSVEARAFPIVPIAAGAIAVGVLLLLVLGGSSSPDRPPAPPAVEAGGAAEPAGAAPMAPTNAAPPQVPGGPAAPAARPPDIPSPAGPSPGAVTAELERALGRQRLWSSVQATGERVDVRSGACAEPEMGPAIDAAQAALRGAGLTRLRCLAQSGAVVFERDL